jgi:hypothetical protein
MIVNVQFRRHIREHSFQRDTAPIYASQLGGSVPPEPPHSLCETSPPPRAHQAINKDVSQLPEVVIITAIKLDGLRSWRVRRLSTQAILGRLPREAQNKGEGEDLRGGWRVGWPRFENKNPGSRREN